MREDGAEEGIDHKRSPSGKPDVHTTAGERPQRECDQAVAAEDVAFGAGPTHLPSMETRPWLVVTLPALNEQETVGNLVREIHEVMASQGLGFEVLVADDGSTDGTAAVAKEAGATVYSNPRRLGIAETFRVEVEKALSHGASVIVHMDADGQHKATDIPQLIAPILEDRSDLVLGSRFAGGSARMPLLKSVGNRLFSMVVSSITHVKVADSQTGFRAFSRAVAERVELTATYTYTQEQIIRAARSRFRVMEVPIDVAERPSGKSRVVSNTLSYASKVVVGLLRIYRDYEPLKFFGWAGASLVFAAIGIAIHAFITYGTILDTTVIVLLLAGIQIILFGFMADMLRR